MGKAKYIWIIGILVVVISVFMFSSPRGTSFPVVGNSENIKMYKSSSCGCCGVYADYFKRKGNSDVNVSNLESLNLLKQQYEIPQAMESCHTVIIGDYFVEGHVPLEAMEKLLLEKPDIKGIAMPGMPSGSPGMPGTKSGDFIIYAVNRDGSYEEFMRM